MNITVTVSLLKYSITSQSGLKPIRVSVQLYDMTVKLYHILLYTIMFCCRKITNWLTNYFLVLIHSGHVEIFCNSSVFCLFSCWSSIFTDIFNIRDFLKTSMYDTAKNGFHVWGVSSTREGLALHVRGLAPRVRGVSCTCEGLSSTREGVSSMCEGVSSTYEGVSSTCEVSFCFI